MYNRNIRGQVQYPVVPLRIFVFWTMSGFVENKRSRMFSSYVYVLYKREIIYSVYHLFIDALSILGICPKGIICPVYARVGTFFPPWFLTGGKYCPVKNPIQ